jgi:hypothetical protein
MRRLLLALVAVIAPVTPSVLPRDTAPVNVVAPLTVKLANVTAPVPVRRAKLSPVCAVWPVRVATSVTFVEPAAPVKALALAAKRASSFASSITCK